MNIVCLDLEGVLVPEIWIAFAQKTGIEELKRTTRDEPNYDVLMRYRLNILKENNLKLNDIQKVIGSLEPLNDAKEFLNELRKHFQVVILSDTFYEFAMPLMEKLNMPTLFCHHLEMNQENEIINYHLRQKNQKAQAVQVLKSLNFKVFSSGDSYNDLGMLKESDQGFFYNPPENIKNDYQEFPAVYHYQDLLKCFLKADESFK